MHPLTSPIRTPPHGSTSSPHEGTAPPRLPEDTNSLPSPQRGMETLAQHAPSPLFSHWDCSGSTRLVFEEGDAPAYLLRGQLCPLAPPQGGGVGEDPVLPVLDNCKAGAQTQAGSWGDATGRGRASPWTWGQYGDPTPSMLISLPSEGGRAARGRTSAAHEG